MKKLVLGCLLVLFLFLIPTSAQAAMGDLLLRSGSTGADVVELQTKLNAIGVDVGKVDGIFGDQTKQGVMTFQGTHSLAVDGIVGPLTANALNVTYSDQLRQNKISAVISTAKQYLGVKYQWGGSSPQTGFDCSGYVNYVFGQNGISLPRVSKDQYSVGQPVAYQNLQPGDLVFFSFLDSGEVSHDGIYLGNGQFINASTSRGVTIYGIGPYWSSHYVGARRIL